MDGIAERRRLLGLSQADLARAAGLSRPLISAVETGRHLPSVKAALALSRALVTTVEELFGADVSEPAVAAVGPPAESSVGVLAVRVGERLVYQPLPNQGAGASAWLRADGVCDAGVLDLFPDADPTGLAVAGCDPALGLASSLLPTRGPERLVAVRASTGVALEALAAGRIHAALVHGLPGRLGRKVPAQRWRIARWRVGLAMRAGARIELAQVAGGEVRAVRRDTGAQAQKALERALRRAGGTGTVTGPSAEGHLDAARLVASGSADVAVTMETAALAYGLDLVPLEEHVVELWVTPEWTGHPGVSSLLDLVVSKAFRVRLAALGGYDLTDAGRAA